MVSSNVRKNKRTTKCDKSAVTCDVTITKCEDGTIKFDVLINWYSRLPASEYCKNTVKLPFYNRINLLNCLHTCVLASLLGLRPLSLFPATALT